MFKITTFLSQNITAEKDNFWLFVPVFIGFGAAYYCAFEEGFLINFFLLLSVFCLVIFLSFLNRYSFRSFLFISCALFLAGSFYGFFYQKFFLNQTEITGKIYVDVVGKVESVKKFTNPVNHLEGLNLVILEPQIYKSEFVKKKKDLSKKKSKKKVTKKKIQKNKTSKQKVKNKKAKKVSTKIVERDFINLANYQEVDRKFLDYTKSYQQVDWVKVAGRKTMQNPPKKISVNVVKNFSTIDVNDVIAFKALLQPVQKKEFSTDFDFSFDAKLKKIGAYGFILGQAKVITKSEISNLESWFLLLRSKINQKINSVTSGGESAIIAAFLIGDQSQISKEMLGKIRNSGLSHLLSISGFHLSLACSICFVATRFLMARSEYLILRFDLKKLAAITAILGGYFYLKIAASPLSAKRAFLMVTLFFLAVFVQEKVNVKRSIMIAALILILANPYSVFNISFQLSFAAILVLTSFYSANKNFENHNFIHQVFRYFYLIIFVSIILQIALTPLLMHSFQNISLLGFIANILAIPLTSFVIMPLGFLALILMPFSLEKYFLLLMKQSIILLEKIIIFVGDLDFSHIISPSMSNAGVIFAIVGLLFFCLLQSKIRFFGIFLFLFSFVTLFFEIKPDILFEKNQKFFALKTENGFVFSKNLRPSKQRQNWLNKLEENNFKSLVTNPQKEVFCDKDKCVINKEKNFLVLLKRVKNSVVCSKNTVKNFDVIINLSRKYKLPECLPQNIKKIDNIDFYQNGGQFFYFDGRAASF